MSVLKQSIAGTEPHLYEVAAPPPGAQTTRKKPPTRALVDDPLMTAEEVAGRLNVSTDWVWDHSSRKKPYLPVIYMSDGTLRYRQSRIESFIDERERVSALRHRAS